MYFCFTALGGVVIHCQPPHTEKLSADRLKTTFYSGAILKINSLNTFCFAASLNVNSIISNLFLIDICHLEMNQAHRLC